MRAPVGANNTIRAPVGAKNRKARIATNLEVPTYLYLLTHPHSEALQVYSSFPNFNKILLCQISMNQDRMEDLDFCWFIKQNENLLRGRLSVYLSKLCRGHIQPTLQDHHPQLT